MKITVFWVPETVIFPEQDADRSLIAKDPTSVEPRGEAVFGTS